MQEVGTIKRGGGGLAEWIRNYYLSQTFSIYSTVGVQGPPLWSSDPSFCLQI
jgi:hypothetical protein